MRKHDVTGISANDSKLNLPIAEITGKDILRAKIRQLIVTAVTTQPLNQCNTSNETQEKGLCYAIITIKSTYSINIKLSNMRGQLSNF